VGQAEKKRGGGLAAGRGGVGVKKIKSNKNRTIPIQNMLQM
jgi:hypothetical protein